MWPSPNEKNPHFIWLASEEAPDIFRIFQTSLSNLGGWYQFPLITFYFGRSLLPIFIILLLLLQWYQTNVHSLIKRYETFLNNSHNSSHSNTISVSPIFTVLPVKNKYEHGKRFNCLHWLRKSCVSGVKPTFRQSRQLISVLERAGFLLRFGRYFHKFTAASVYFSSNKVS